MPDFESGVYVITNCLYHNNAAPLHANADEVVRGIPPIDGEPRDIEKVDSVSFPDSAATDISFAVAVHAPWQETVLHQKRRFSAEYWSQHGRSRGW